MKCGGLLTLLLERYQKIQYQIISSQLNGCLQVSYVGLSRLSEVFWREWLLIMNQYSLEFALELLFSLLVCLLEKYHERSLAKMINLLKQQGIYFDIKVRGWCEFKYIVFQQKRSIGIPCGLFCKKLKLARGQQNLTELKFVQYLGTQKELSI